MNEMRTVYVPCNSTGNVGTQGASGETIVSCSNYFNFAGTLSRQGSIVPGFREKIRNMENATSNFVGRKFAVKRKSTAYTFVWGNVPVGSRSSISHSGDQQINGSFADPSTLSSTVADNIAKRKLLQDILDRRSAFQGGTFVAEIRDTLRGLRHPLKSMRDGLTLYHREAKKLSKRHKGAILTKAISGTWLEYQFSISQNVRDVDSALENLRRISKPRSLKFKVSGKSDSSTVSSSGFTLAGCAGMDSTISYRMKRTDTVIVIYRGAYKVLPPSGWDWKSWGLSTQDFLPSVWEAIPYSFAVDYFTNIGQIIQAYSYLFADIAWVARTVRGEVVYRSDVVKVSPKARSYPLILNQQSLGYTQLALTSVNRATASVSSLIPRLTFQVPGATSLKWLNIAALGALKTL